VDELAISELATTTSNDVNYLFSRYNSTLSSLIDKHAPQRTVMRRQRHRAPWYDAECRSMKRQVRHLESVFRRRRLYTCHTEWRNAVVRYHQLLGSMQRSFGSGRVLESDGDSRALWKTLSSMMSPPASQTASITPAEFVAHFKGEVDTIRALTTGAPMPGVERTCSSSLSSYKRVTTQDIERLLGRCPNTQCALDPVPTWLVKAAGTTMTAILTKLVNSSLDSAMFPSSMKHAIVTPIIKKHGMDSSSLSSYRPISNLPFVSKLLERIVAGQLTTYLNTNHLLPTNQSAYLLYHSTEIALLAICNDALIAADRGIVTLVVSGV